jgi:hypothetical protein
LLSDSRTRGKGVSQEGLVTKNQTAQETKQQYDKFWPADACKSDIFDMIVVQPTIFIDMHKWVKVGEKENEENQNHRIQEYQRYERTGRGQL